MSAPTNAWHVAHHMPPTVLCDVCGAGVRDNGPRHELCRLRRNAGYPTPPLNDRPPCPCRPCVLARKAEGGRP